MAQAATRLSVGSLYHSSLNRATQTAEIISTFLSIPMRSYSELKELDLGDLDGMTSTQVSKQFPKLISQWRTDPSLVTMPNGESLEQLQSRVSLIIGKLNKLHIGSSNKSIMIVSHNFAIISFLCYILNIPLSRFHQFQVDLASFTIIESRCEKWRLISSNNTNHLLDDDTA